jgi:hypothetical protein
MFAQRRKILGGGSKKSNWAQMAWMQCN